ncbi:hypothetical protein FACS1894191_3320 [Clostridia bacterium]|nr:hypothetical protein FACS1894191_3320 [Clostridia bacterium]
MRKYENVDIIAALGAVVEINTEHYKNDFKYDVDMFKAAAVHPDGDNNHLLFMSRQSGTWCVKEREAYIRDTEAFNIWNGYATILGDIKSYMSTVVVQDRILTYAVEIKGMENGRVKGDIYELDYREHIRQINRSALPRHTVTATYKDGTALTLSPAEHDGRRERLYHQHGQLQTLTSHPEDEGALRDILKQAREQRGKDATPAAFKVRVQNPKPQKPGIKQQLAAGKAQLDRKRAAAPRRTAAKTKSNDLEV